MVAVIIVTYNSQKHIYKAMECVLKQTLPARAILIVDTGSEDRSYLDAFKIHPQVKVIYAEKNAGFCRGNNVGMQHVPKECDYVFLLNPDAFLTPQYLEKAVHLMQQNSAVGALTGVTLGYDMEKELPTGRYDTTGVFSTWYGRWYDRAQGQLMDNQLFRQTEFLPAICGAVFFCRKSALESVFLQGMDILDRSFYMYKEDVDLSVRLRKKGWKLLFSPGLIAYHCRGWNSKRSLMPRLFRKLSAKNEVRVNFRASNPFGMLYSSLKFAAVKLFDV